MGTLRTGGQAPRSQGPAPRKPKWGSVTLNSKRLCMNPECQTRTKKGCTCDELCTLDGQTGVLMCKKCFLNKESHAAAADAHWDGVDVLPGRSAMAWTQVS